jgi:hypothetical protein
MPRINSINFSRAFVHSAGAILLTSALVIFISCASNQQVILPHDPVFLLSLPNFFCVVGGFELVVALICLFGKNVILQTTFV